MRPLSNPLLIAGLVLFATGSWTLAQNESSPALDSGVMPSETEPLISTDEGLVRSFETMPHDPLANWNLPLPTTGGIQFWTDHRWWNGWRVQSNSTLLHWRLIDPNSIRRGWGTKEAMLAMLERVRIEKTAMDPSAELSSEAPVFVLMHGLMRTPGSMKPVAKAIQKRFSDFQQKASDSPNHTPQQSPVIVPFTYASTRDPLSEHASALREVIENLPGKPRWNAIGHSMGNIVLRTAIAQWQAQGDPHGALERLDRVVMLGPPNQGSSFAKKLSQLGLFEQITGDSGMTLGPNWRELQTHFGVPPCPFAVIAGDVSSLHIRNPWLEGPNDGVVTIEETKLDGMRDFATAPVLHSFLTQDQRCIDATVEFLMGGELQSVLAK